MQLYLNETVFRWNYRNNTIDERYAGLFGFINSSEPLPYKAFLKYVSVTDQRPPKKIERIEDFQWNACIYSLVIDGIEYINPMFKKK